MRKEKPVSSMKIPIEPDYSMRTVYVKGETEPLKYKMLRDSRVNVLLITPDRKYRYVGNLGKGDQANPDHWTLHRNSEPAMTIEDYIFGKYDVPFMIEKSLHWFTDGQRHRLVGPAVITYDKDNKVKSHEWFVTGNRHIDVDKWIKQMKLPPWQEWTHNERTLFTLKFFGL